MEKYGRRAVCSLVGGIPDSRKKKCKEMYLKLYTLSTKAHGTVLVSQDGDFLGVDDSGCGKSVQAWS